MKFDVILKGGRVFDPEQGVDEPLDIGIREGRIAELSKPFSNQSAQADTVIDLSGLTAIPGVIDMHVHVTNLLGGSAGYYMAAKTGVTTIIDYAGPVKDITACLNSHGCGMNVGCIEAVLPEFTGQSPSRTRVKQFLEQSLENGALGLKILGGHYPLTPEAERYCIEEANKQQVMIACHVGSTENRSDIEGLKEAVNLAKGQRLLMAHINAYCRGARYHYLDELKDAFQLLRENENIISDSHLSVGNGTSGACRDGKLCDEITVNCLKMFGCDPTREGLADALRSGLAKAVAALEQENVYLEKEEAVKYWNEHETNVYVSFPANLSSVAAACLLERNVPGGKPLIQLAATDGGGFPRNGLIQKLLPFYRLGYLTLKEVVEKCSVNPAKVFGLWGKGRLGIGADADITVIDLDRLDAVMSFAGGRKIMDHAIVTGKGGTLLTTPAGVKVANDRQLACQLADTKGSALYHEIL